MPESSIQANTHVVRPEQSDLSESERKELREAALNLSRSSPQAPEKHYSSKPREIYRHSVESFNKLENELVAIGNSAELSTDLRVLIDNLRLVRTDILDLEEGTRAIAKLPEVRTANGETIPRTIVLARALLSASENRLTESIFSTFLSAAQEVDALTLAELSGMLPTLKLVLLEMLTQIGPQALSEYRAHGAEAPTLGIDRITRSLRVIGDLDWKETLEQLSVVHATLCLDPAGVYPAMDFESREYYRQTLKKIAAHSDVDEVELARRIVATAESAKIPRGADYSLRNRLKHVGYYLVDENGRQELLDSIGYRAPIGAAIQRFFHRFPDEIYIIGIEFVTLITVVGLIMSLVRTSAPLGLIMGALLLIIPAAQSAVELMNYFVSAVLTPFALAKFDYSEGVDPAAATIVAIPTLLINEKQIQQLVDDLEVRYLVNRDPNIFYALLTDLPDSAEPVSDNDPRIDLAIRLIDGLNEKYAGEPYGGFYLFHRHRVYNPREGAWMGWERKRGKLLDLNQMLRNVFDPFPVKAGDMARLPTIKYVLTLDSDTQLPRGAAQRLIGTIAHPLNHAFVDPELNIVTQGYGILQPRVGISVHSATRSRLASIYSGQTGFDIYSRAISDVYQDLYGEGIFTGKGIYDVDALRQVLERRFPRNALLSHDLIEGAYARAGLVSDIEVIDDYPSHYSAYNRRKHRWLRGDWQIVRWLFGRVPDESRRLVPNPISLVSKWKIVDNLRRSLLEPSLFVLLVAGWFFLPGGPRFWTFVTLALLFLPIYFRLVFTILTAAFKKKWEIAREAFIDFFTSHVSIFLNIAFLAHQAMVSIDAVVRTVIRSTITHTRLLEWETATEAELGLKKRTPVDVYLDWIPILAGILGLSLYFRPEALPYALPFIITWGLSKLISVWLNRSPHPSDFDLADKELQFLREVALRTWRYFAEFSSEKNHWLIPDNVQEEPYRVAERLSPTNLGLLLNSRQAALEFGYLTLSEYAAQTDNTLQSALKLPRYFGHFLNWYDNLTMQPLTPMFISSVDSGNLLASLWSLKQGTLELIRQPIIKQSALVGLDDHYCLVKAGKNNGSNQLARLLEARDPSTWLPEFVRLSLVFAEQDKPSSEHQHVWWPSELKVRIDALRSEALRFLPWYLPEYQPLRDLKAQGVSFPSTIPSPASADKFYQDLEQRLHGLAINSALSEDVRSLVLKLRDELPSCRAELKRLASRLSAIAELAEQLVQDMDFEMMVDRRRNLLSIGYDVTAGELNKSCYDLLASESRTATFLAVAKGEAPQESWFRLGRSHTFCEGESVLVSWTGTMFEYLMPAIWMKSHPNTLLDRAVRGAVRAQQFYGGRHHVPWGISEAAFSKTDADGNYQYAAFGVPGLALSAAYADSLVISPYSSCLALLVDPVTGVENLLKMAGRKWLSEYGFYESVDFTGSRARWLLRRKGIVVRCWMSHHQGMSLAAICNILHDAPFQRWFHAEPLVQASELILQERPLRVRPINEPPSRRIFAAGRKLLRGPATRVKASA